MSSEPVTIDPERLQRLIDAISLLGVGEHAAALAIIPEPDNADEPFALLEVCTRVLVGEVVASQTASAHHAAELERSRQQLAERLAEIQRQSVMLADLSTPIIEVWEHTLALPIIGAIDAGRAAMISAALLRGVAERRARAVLVDLTGAQEVDPATFEHLTRLARAVELLGARCLFTGLSPAVARALVAMDLDLGAIRTLPTLKEGLRAVIDGARSDTRAWPR